MANTNPLLHFAVLNITQFLLATGVSIFCQTNNPCHLTCYYTNVPPRRHKTSRIVRGLALLTQAYWCFDAWKTVEQQEAGDTLTHTFYLTPWPVCETRWFVLRGTVGGVLSPSASPIFEKHNTGLSTYGLFEHYSTGGSYNMSYHQYMAQTFTPAITHLITAVKLYMCRGSFPPFTATIGVDIKATDAAGKPTGPPLASGSFPRMQLSEPSHYIWKDVALTPPCILLPGFTYALVIHGSGNSAHPDTWRLDHIAGAYLGGQFWISSNGTTWIDLFPVAQADAYFEEWGYS